MSTNGPPGDTGMPSFNTAVSATRPGRVFSVLPASVAGVGRLLLSLEIYGPRMQEVGRDARSSQLRGILGFGKRAAGVEWR